MDSSQDLDKSESLSDYNILSKSWSGSSKDFHYESPQENSFAKNEAEENEKIRIPLDEISEKETERRLKRLKKRMKRIQLEEASGAEADSESEIGSRNATTQSFRSISSTDDDSWSEPTIELENVEGKGSKELECNIEIEEQQDERFDILSAFESRVGLEIVLYIFSYVSMSDIARLCLVCKAFRSYAMNPQLSQWRHLNLFPFRHKVNDQILQRVVKKCLHLKSLDLKYCKMIKTTRSLEKLSLSHSLDSLEVINFSGTIFQEDSLLDLAKKILASCPRLTFIDFSWTRLNKAQTIQSLLQYESSRQEFTATKRKKLLTLRFSSSLHIRSGEKLLRNMNVRVEFIEKRDNNTKLKLLLFPFREEHPYEEMPKLPISGSLRAKAAIPLWKVGLFTYTTLKMDIEDVDDVFPEDYVELYYNNTLLTSIYSMSLSSILDSFVYTKNSKPSEGITLYYRKASVARRKDPRAFRVEDRASPFCPICLHAFPGYSIDGHLMKCSLVHVQRALDMPEGIHHLFMEDVHPWRKKSLKASRVTELSESKLSAYDYNEEVICWSHGNNVALIPEQTSSELIVRGSITCHNVNPINQGLVFGFRDGEILYTNQLHKHQRETLEFNRYGNLNIKSVAAVEWIPNRSSEFVAAFTDGNFYVYDINKGATSKPPKVFHEAKKATGSVIIHNKKDSNPVSMWHVVGENRQISGMKFAPGSNLLAVIYTNCIQIFDIAREKFVAYFQEKEINDSKLRQFFSINWSMDNHFFVVGGYGGISLWDFRKRESVDIGLIGHQVAAVEFDHWKCTREEYRLACVTDVGFLGIWSFRSEDPKLQLLRLMDLGGILTSILFMSSSLAVSWLGGRVRVWKRPPETITNAEALPTLKRIPSLKERCLGVIEDHWQGINFDTKERLGSELAISIVRQITPHLLDNQLHREIMNDVERTDKKCKGCGNSFGMFRHRHSCRMCYALACSSCFKHFDLGNIPGNAHAVVNICVRCLGLLSQC